MASLKKNKSVFSLTSWPSDLSKKKIRETSHSFPFHLGLRQSGLFQLSSKRQIYGININGHYTIVKTSNGGLRLMHSNIIQNIFPCFSFTDA